MLADDITKRNLSLVSIKDNGPLIYPSEDVVSVLIVCARHFHYHVRGLDGKQINSSKRLYATVYRDVVRELSITRPGKILFPSLLQHDFDTHIVSEDYHSTQIMKAAIKFYLDEITSLRTAVHSKVKMRFKKTWQATATEQACAV